ncbi:hypothetical protein D3C72_2360690 [compost metagenome]
MVLPLRAALRSPIMLSSLSASLRMAPSRSVMGLSSFAPDCSRWAMMSLTLARWFLAMSSMSIARADWTFRASE